MTYDLQLSSLSSDLVHSDAESGFAFTGLAANRRYDIRLRSRDSNSVSEWSTPLETLTRPTAPESAPQVVRNMPGETSITIGWRVDVALIDDTDRLSVDLAWRAHGSSSFVLVNADPLLVADSFEHTAPGNDNEYRIRLRMPSSLLSAGANTSPWSPIARIHRALSSNTTAPWSVPVQSETERVLFSRIARGNG